MHATRGQMHVYLYVRSIGSQGKCTRTHSGCHTARFAYVRTCATSSPPAPRSTMPIITYRPRSIPLLADSSRCCLIHATPRFHGGLLVLSRRGRVGFFGAHNEPQGQVWTSLYGSVASACPTRAGAGYSPSPSTSFFARATFPFPPSKLPLFFPRELLKTEIASPWRDFLPFGNWKSLRAALLLPKGKMHGFIGGCSSRCDPRSVLRYFLAMSIVNVDAIESFLLSKRRTWALFPKWKAVDV